MYKNRKRKGSEFTNITIISTITTVLQLYYYYLLFRVCAWEAGLLVDWFHAKGSVSLLVAARSRSEGATYDLRAREYEELNKLFLGGYLLVIGLPWLDC